jgi:hypothetical protein
MPRMPMPAAMITEVSYFAQRGFAGGQAALVSGYFEGETYQRAVVTTLQKQSVPFVVIPGRRIPTVSTARFRSSPPTCGPGTGRWPRSESLTPPVCRCISTRAWV